MVRTKSVDTVAERQQTAVDVRTFNHSLTTVLCVSGTFRAGKVNEEEFAYSELLMNASDTLTLSHGNY